MRWRTVLLIVVMGIAAEAVAAGKDCAFAMRSFSDGSVSCQGGRQFRCADGAWQGIGTACADAAPGGTDVRVSPGVKEPAVRKPSVNQPGGAGAPQVDQPPRP